MTAALRPILTRLTGNPRARWAVTLAGALALSAVVWVAAPLVVLAGHRPLEDAGSRAALAALILLAWALGNARADRRERRANERLVAALSASPDPEARQSLEEITGLEARLADVLRRLRTQRFGARFGGRYLYQLPWYLMIGAPGSGKTTALAASGLGFPLGEGAHALSVPGLGGTRSCDWWFTDDAVIVDTAGRYTTQDSRHAVDSRVWSGLLELLKEHRPRQPVNGVLVTVSLPDLATWSDGDRRAHALTIRKRLVELRGQLGLRPPIYVVCTKADLVSGFTGFFDALTEEERRQVWGMTFPMGDGPGGLGPAAWFRDTFTALLRRLDERLLERLHQEPDIERRALNFTFPLQMASLEGPLADLIETVFAVGPEEEALLLRGVYVTSATQGGLAVDRLAAPFAAFGAGAAVHAGDQPVQRQSYFLERLLREVVFAEANLAGVDRVLERARRRRQGLAVGATLAATVAVAGFWANSHGGNAALIDRIAAAVARAEGAIRALDTPPRSLTRVEDTDFAAVLPALDALRAIPAGYAHRGEWPSFVLAGGLYQGDRLGPRADAVYRRALRSVFLSRLVLRLEEQLRTGWARPDQLRLSLRAYRMIGGREPLDPAFVAEWMAADWQRTLPGPAHEDRRRALGEHLAALFDIGFAAVPLDDALIDRVLEVLEQAAPRPMPFPSPHGPA
jgi:type VI secretion system protein ImpL